MVHHNGDQGSECKGAVKKLMEVVTSFIVDLTMYNLGISSNYALSLCSKFLTHHTGIANLLWLERSHRTWKRFLFYDVLGGFDEFMNNKVKCTFE